MDPVWEQLHSSRDWGKYPAEDLIRTVMRSYKSSDTSQLKVLEVGFGAGANLAFFLNEGFQTYGIEGSPSAVSNARQRLSINPASESRLELLTGDFVELPWQQSYFDIVVDHMAIYANIWDDIQKTFDECYRVLKPGGHLYSRSWAQGCLGFDTGELFEPGTSRNPASGPCKDMGTSHFFSEAELIKLSGDYSESQLRLSRQQEIGRSEEIREWLLWARK